jgi:hypothetical protein
MDWQTIDTNTIDGQWKMNQIIAERLGWHLVKVHPPEIITGDNDGFGKPFRIELHWTMVNKHGKRVMGAWQTPELIYEHAPYPDFVGRLSKAIKLFEKVSDDYTPRLVRILVPHGVMTHEWKAVIMGNVTDEQYEAMHENPATAICLAWLAYDDAIKAAQP